MAMIVAVHQPQYLPWLGYFDKIDRADAFVLLDNVQFKKNEWQNRNRIKTSQGWQWLTVPVQYKYPQRINEVRINPNTRWQHKHKQAISTHYGKAPCFAHLESSIEELWDRNWEMISVLNIETVRKLVDLIGIGTPIYVASELENFPDDPDERLIAIARYFGAKRYLAGAGARGYMKMDKYSNNGIEVEFQNFEHPIYDQLYGDFIPNLSVIDLLMNHGENSLNILRKCRKQH